MMDWDRVRIFRGVAEAGSFTRAADSLGLSQSAISRQISALEEDLRTPLFHRHARGLVLTEQGEILLEAPRRSPTAWPWSQTRLDEAKDHPAGHLRINTTIGFGTVWLTAPSARVSRALPGHHGVARGDGHRARPQHARGRRRDPAQPAAPARPDPEAADDGPHPSLRRAGVSRRARRRSRPSRTSTAIG